MVFITSIANGKYVHIQYLITLSVILICQIHLTATFLKKYLIDWLDKVLDRRHKSEATIRTNFITQTFYGSCIFDFHRGQKFDGVLGSQEYKNPDE